MTGSGMITAHGIGTKTNWIKIKSGMSGIQEIASFDASKYRGKTGGEAREFSTTTLNNLKSKRLDRASHLLIHTTREALLDADIIDAVKNIPTLLSVGTTLGGMISGEIFHKEAIKKGLNRAKVSRVFDYLAHYQAIHLFKELGLKGDFFVFSNACASGTDAIGHAFNSIRCGDYDVAICGGYDTISEFSFAGFNSLMAITPTFVCLLIKGERDWFLGKVRGFWF